MPSSSCTWLAPAAQRVLGIGNQRKAGSLSLGCCAGQLSPCLRAAQSPASSSCKKMGVEAKGEWRMLCLSSEIGSFTRAWWALGAEGHLGMLSDAHFGKMLVSEPKDWVFSLCHSMGGVWNEEQPLLPWPAEFQISRGETFSSSTGLCSSILAPFLAFIETGAPACHNCVDLQTKCLVHIGDAQSLNRVVT